MSEDLNRDIQTVLNRERSTSGNDNNSPNITIPEPNVLRHGLEDGVVIGQPVYRQDGKEK